MNLTIAGHALQRFWVNTEQLCRFIAVQEWLENKFFIGLSWLEEGANLDGWDADITDSLVKSPNSGRFGDFWILL
ncbi:MAG TPA: hypothetical protein VMQ17_04620 [Candidatus Sulfotelmatobacter sp.]|nr:hypothetical protein [Candidatus Sulfotelmatobacter sp.]